MARKKTSPTLAELQHWFRDVLDTNGGAAGARGKTAAMIARMIVPSRTLTPAQRIDIYAGMYHYRLRDVLLKDFPACAHAMRERVWLREVNAYIRKHPSRHQNLNHFNAAFPGWLKTRRGLKHYKFLSELASLEWSMVCAVHARTSQKPDVGPLRTLTPAEWERVTFRAAPSFELFAFEYPVNAWLQAFREDKSPGIPRRRRSWTAVHRQDYTVWRSTLSKPMYHMLHALRRGEPLVAAVEQTLETRAIGSRALAGNIQKWFGRFMSDGFFEAVMPPVAANLGRRGTTNHGDARTLAEILQHGPERALRPGTRVRERKFASEAVMSSTAEAAVPERRQRGRRKA